MSNNVGVNPIICALDMNDYTISSKLTRNLSPYVGMVKVGLESFIYDHYGAINVASMHEVDVFLDLKFYDIPNTVEKAIKPFTYYKYIKMMTIHGSGSVDMIKAAVNAAENIDIIAVTLLTSTEEKNATEIVLKIAEKSLKNGAAGIVCSAREVLDLRKEFGNDFKIVVPGVRPKWYTTSDDQRRTGTPSEIINNGATNLVIGRPITSSDNPVEATKKILEELK